MELIDTLGTSLVDAFGTVSNIVAVFLPKIFLSLLILIIGWVFGVTIGKFISQIISALKVDRAMEELGVGTVLTRAGFRLHMGTFLGKIVEWFIIVIFLVASLEVLGLTQITIFLQDTVLNYLPNVIIAAIILVLAALISDAVHTLVVGSSKAGGLPSAHLLGGISKWAIWVFAIIAALKHLGIAPDLLQTLFTGIVYMLTIAGGLAFGLGGKEVAAGFIYRLRGDISERKR